MVSSRLNIYERAIYLLITTNDFGQTNEGRKKKQNNLWKCWMSNKNVPDQNKNDR